MAFRRFWVNAFTTENPFFFKLLENCIGRFWGALKGLRSQSCRYRFCFGQKVVYTVLELQHASAKFLFLFFFPFLLQIVWCAGLHFLLQLVWCVGLHLFFFLPACSLPFIAWPKKSCCCCGVYPCLVGCDRRASPP